jgi:HEAT repeat protein
MDELQRQAAEVRSLGEAPPSPERWTALHAALHSKFEGTQSLALRVLGRWGGPDAVAALRQFLSEAYHRPYSWAIRGVAAEELAKVATADDVAWILDLYFQLDDALEKHELVRLVIALPPDAARARLVAELQSADPLNRQAAVKAIGNMRCPDRRALLWPLREDPDGLVRKSAPIFTQEA